MTKLQKQKAELKNLVREIHLLTYSLEEVPTILMDLASHLIKLRRKNSLIDWNDLKKRYYADVREISKADLRWDAQDEGCPRQQLWYLFRQARKGAE